VKSLLPSRFSFSSLKSFEELTGTLLIKNALLFPYKDAFICIALPIRVNQQGQTERLASVLEKFIANYRFKTIESHKVFCIEA